MKITILAFRAILPCLPATTIVSGVAWVIWVRSGLKEGVSYASHDGFASCGQFSWRPGGLPLQQRLRQLRWWGSGRTCNQCARRVRLRNGRPLLRTGTVDALRASGECDSLGVDSDPGDEVTRWEEAVIVFACG